MKEFDVYLNGLGYMLVKDDGGAFLQGAAQVTKTDPFTRYVSQEERWERRSFRFNQGAGALFDDESKRYAYGYDVDSRGGALKRGGLAHSTRTGALDATYEIVDPDNMVGNVRDYELTTIVGPGENRVALQVVWGSARTVRTIRVLVKRDPRVDYTGAANFDVELWSDVANAPNALVAGCTASMSIVATPLHWLPHENLWLEHRYYWLECHFAQAVAVGAGTYWIVVRNEAAGNQPLFWGYHDGTSTRVAFHDGLVWTVNDTGDAPFCTCVDRATIDASTRSLAVFRGDPAGADRTRRVYAGPGCNSMFWDDATEYWVWLREFANPILDMLDFNSRLFVATGPAVAGPPEGGLHYYDGDHVTTPGPPPGLWVHVNAGATIKDGAYCLALHDNMIWKACSDPGPPALPFGSCVIGSRTGLAGAWASDPHIVGDPRTAISKLSSHGGKLFAVKPEGLFEISYPDAYPGAGIEATSNLVHDFRTDRTGRGFCLDWHSALYFPGTGGIFEWKSGILRDMWRERFTPDEATSPAWPVYDAQKGYFRMATATTRGLLFGSFSPYLPTEDNWWQAGTWPNEPEDIGQVWFWDGQWFHPLMVNPFKCEQLYAGMLEDRGEGYGWMWWGSGLDIFYVEWPNWTQDRSGDRRSEFMNTADGFFVMPEFDDDRPDLQKDWHEIRVRSTALSSVTADGGAGSLYLFMALDDGVMETVGNVDESPMGVLTFPEASTSYKIQLAGLLDPELSDETVTPKIHAIDLLYQPLPETITQYQVWIRAVKHLKRHRGTPDLRSARVIWEELSALLELLEPFEYEDALGVTHCVRAAGATEADVTQVERPSDEGTGMQVEGAIIVTMLEVSEECPS